MEDKKQPVVDEQDIRDWIVVSNIVTEKELIKKFMLDKKALTPVVERMLKEGIVSVKNGLFNKTIFFEVNSPQGKKELSRLLPSVSSFEEKKMYKTNLDLLKNMVDRFGSIELGRVARFFNTPPETVEGWAKMLHPKFLILFYPLAGEPILSKKGVKHNPVNLALVKYLILAALIFLAVYERNLWLPLIKKWLVK